MIIPVIFTPPYHKPPKPELPLNRALTPQERADAIEYVKADAIAMSRTMGCTCPEIELVEAVSEFGPYRLPVYVSQHPESCPMAQLKDSET